jgi:adenine deaminase
LSVVGSRIRDAGSTVPVRKFGITESGLGGEGLRADFRGVKDLRGF